VKATVIESPLGILGFDDHGSILEKVLFPRGPRSAAELLLKIQSGRMVNQVAELIELLQKKGYGNFIFENPALGRAVAENLGVEVETITHSEERPGLRDFERFAIETGFVKDGGAYRVWMHNVTMEIAKLKVRGAVEKRDLVVAQAIQALDDLDKIINLLMSHVREWFGIHFPELDRMIEKHETYVRLVLKLGRRGRFTAEALEENELPKEKATEISRAAKMSMGADVAESDLIQIQGLCGTVEGLYGMRQEMEKYLDETMETVAPNVKALAGSLLGARLIALAGGLVNLARKPSSTIQVLGAEKALFRSLKTGTRPPKHGIIFQHTIIHEAKRWHRGKIARALAGKLAIAARADAFGGQYIGAQLKASLENRIDEIRKKYAEPPPIPIRSPSEKEWRPHPQREQRDRFRRGKTKWRKHRREGNR
jgi:nucleolar protein 56